MLGCDVVRPTIKLLLLAFLFLGAECLDAAERASVGMSRLRIRQLLSQIVLDEAPAVDGFSLREVAELLDREARRRDPAGIGINFIVNPNIVSLPRGGQGNVSPPQPGVPVPPLIDPNTGLPIPQAQPVAPVNPAKGIDPDAVKVKGLTVPLRRVTLGQFLDAITKSFDTPVRVSIEEYAVVFMHKNPDEQDIFTRTFRLNPNAFGQGLTPAGPAPGGPAAK